MSASSSKDLGQDAPFYFDEQEQSAFVTPQPWRSDPKYFQNVKISAVALLKLVMHACSGGRYEVMGALQGKTEPNTFYVLDAYALPVEGTETRVNADDSAHAFHFQYADVGEQLGRKMPDVGWYHSHPGYTCWMSGIDVQTQALHQAVDPYLAIVVDPISTITSGRIDIGAFRTYPTDYTPPEAKSYQTIPLDKVKDWGNHANRYYKLKTTFFHSKTDDRILAAMQQKVWVSTVSTTTFVLNNHYYTKQLTDFVSKMRELLMHGESSQSTDEALNQDAQKILVEQSTALATHLFRHAIFAHR